MAMERVAVAVTSGLLLAVLLATFAPSPALAIDCGRNKSHNAFIGSRHWDDKLLFMDHPKKESKWLRTVSADVATGNLRGIINYIEVLDQKTNGNGGCAYLTSGGAGTNNVAFHIKSQRSHGLDFIIRAWGRPY
uniref:Salivary secreted peptide n=1 Tax=Lygus lineolaris TaxID=50650 RepID=A5HMQ0_LYGLI|nr:unknown [Lygus lineolaris]